MSVCSENSHTTSSSLLSKMSVEPKSNAGRSQLHWKLFRRDVLALHHIRILEALPTDHLPDEVVSYVDRNRNNTSRFTKQRRHFRKQVSNGRGFGDSALFPHEVLPWTKGAPFISRCMVPSLSTEALPEKMLNAPDDKGSLSQPRPGLGCGFSNTAFAKQELTAMPEFMQATGTAIDFSSGSIASGTSIIAPFLTFERAFNQHTYGLEVARNQCAVNGAWCVRALQMLYAKATTEDAQPAFESPVAFSCAIDNTVAMINYHWVDHAQTYCMAPIVRFELTRDDHFNQLLVWIEAIGHWGVHQVLPNIKKAISMLGDFTNGVPALIKPSRPRRLDTASIREEQQLVTALKTSYENIPWRFECDDGSAVSSSTASWGSPMINEAIFSKFQYPIIPPPIIPKGLRSPASEPMSAMKSVRFAGVAERQLGIKRPALNTALVPKATKAAPPLPLTPPLPMDDISPDSHGDLVLKKRLDHAMDEIRDLHQQLMGVKQEMSGSTSCLQTEVAGLRQTMTSVIRKERFSFKQAPTLKGIEGASAVQTEQRVDFQKNVSIITTPTEPAPRPPWARTDRPNMPRKSSGLKHVLSLDTSMSASVSTTTTKSAGSPDQCKSPGGCQSPITIFSPTIINYNGFQEEELEDENPGALIRVPASHHSMWSPVLTTNLLSILVPSAMLRVIFLGFVLDYCMMSMSGKYTPSVSTYMAQVMENAFM